MWDENLQQLVNISGGFALKILEYLNTSEEWKEIGIIIGEPATQIFIDHPERKSEHVLINQMHLDPERTEGLLVNLQSNISVLQEIEEMEKEGISQNNFRGIFTNSQFFGEEKSKDRYWPSRRELS